MKYLLFFVIIVFVNNIDAGIFRSKTNKVIASAKRSTCIITLTQRQSRISQGCGVLFTQKTAKRSSFYCLTAFHVIAPAIMDSTMNINIGSKLSDLKLFAIIGQNNAIDILWHDQKKDIAILQLNPPFKIIEKDSTYFCQRLPVLSKIVNYKNVSLGKEVYLLGYSHKIDFNFSYVLKSGIIATIIEQNPLIDNYPSFYVDVTANNGMSGGLVFDNKGQGVGIISSYLYTGPDNNRFSADLTVVIPISLFVQKIFDLNATARGPK